MTAKATDRPWYGKTQSNGQGIIYEESTGKSVAGCYNDGDAEFIADTMNAYDKLVANNKALVAALEDAKNTLYAIHHGNPEESRPSSILKAANRINTALAQARGE